MPTGTVYLVGAGPGDPGLLTLRGLACLQRADLVLYDGLVNPLLLRHSRAQAERTFRGESRSTHTLKQQEINARLIAAAQAGQTVVRLKGGDPYVFGRGSEEAAALANAGIPFEVVPGVTAAVAAGAYAGFSLTHRDHASAVAFITGHEDPVKGVSALDFEALARFPGTLVFYMGLGRIDEIAQRLIISGKPPTTPTAVLSRVTTPHQRTLTATLETIAAEVTRARLPAPSLIVIGSCLAGREAIAWFEQRPLLGQRIGICRARDQAAEVLDRVLALGAEPVVMPLIAIEPPSDFTAIDAALEQLTSYDWIVFTSSNGVAGLLDRLWQRGFDTRRLHHAKLAAIGDGTAAALAEWHLRADLVPTTFRAEALAAALVPHVAGQKVLWARASRGRDVLPTELRAAGAHLDELVVYQNVDVAMLPAEAQDLVDRGELDWICLSSPSIARQLARLCPQLTRPADGTRHPRLCSISPVTTAAAQQAGLTIAAEATEFTWNGLLAAIAHSTARS
ncbi:MAG: uroporphyrinogen-III C-methyltransferase [Planctomycetaceae bacterium]|jgi:uroporphyrinogen III methyltransferase/synthase